MKYLEVFAGVFCNPLVLLAFMMLATTQPAGRYVLSPAGTNVDKINANYYLAYCVVIAVLTWAGLQFHNRFSSTPIAFTTLYHFDNKWLIIGSFFCGALAMRFIFGGGGIEWNVFGFIVFPLLLCGSLLFLIHFFFQPYHFNMDQLKPLNLSLSQAMLIHVFNPLLTLLFFNELANKEDHSGFANTIGGFLFNAVFFYLIAYALHWLLFLFKDQRLNPAMFFNPGGTLVYCLPFILCALYIAVQVAVRRYQDAVPSLALAGHANAWLMLVALSIQAANYVQFWRDN